MIRNQINPYFAFIYPFYGYPLHFPIEKPAQTITNTIITLPTPQPKESPNIIKGHQSEGDLKMGREDSRGSGQLKRKSLRKQKAIKKRQRQDNFARKKQKKDRNIPSNIFKHFITYLYYHPNLQQILPYKAHSQTDLSLLINKLKQHLKETQSYIRPALIQQLCTQSLLSPQQSLIFRMLLKRFLLLDFPILISPMHKFKKRQRKELINYGRKLFEQIKSKKYE